jgi:uncharacterized protein YndB with AHSA1/START domain
MKQYIFILDFLLLAIFSNAQELAESRVVSIIDSANINELIVTQEFVVNVPVDSVWNTYTTKEGWESWATAIADIDFKVNGVIRTNYNKDGRIGDESTITLHVLNYVPNIMLTL